tara:strand:- start:289 stop:570 length:282 start_codon:yes stop_codon:yes gene_type:complete
MTFQNKTIVTNIAPATSFTGSIQKLYSTGSMVLSKCEFGYFQRVGQTGSKAIVQSTITDSTIDKCTSLEGPIVQFETTAGSAAVLVYHDNVKL